MTMLHRSLPALVLTGAFAALACAADEPPAWKLDKPFAQEWKTKVQQSVTITGADGKSQGPTELKQEVTLRVLWTPAAGKGGDSPKPAGDGADKKDDKSDKKDDKSDKKDDKATGAPGEQVLRLKIEGAKVRASVGDDQVESIDLKPADDSKSPLAEALRGALGAEFTVTLSVPSMEVVKVEPPEDWLQGLSAEQRAMIKPLLGAEALKRQAAAAFPPLPAKKGDSLSRSEKFSVGPLGAYNLKTTYTNDGTDDDKMLVLKVECEGDFQPAAASSGYQIKGDGKAKIHATGTALFDPAKGALSRMEIGFKDVSGTMDLVLGKDAVKAEVKETYSASIAPAARDAKPDAGKPDDKDKDKEKKSDAGKPDDKDKKPDLNKPEDKDKKPDPNKPEDKDKKPDPNK